MTQENFGKLIVVPLVIPQEVYSIFCEAATKNGTDISGFITEALKDKAKSLGIDAEF
jgi:hypothetical protein